MRYAKNIVIVLTVTLACLSNWALAEDDENENGHPLCLQTFRLDVRQGPSAGLSLEGVLALAIEHHGAINRASFAVPDRPEVPVVGQANGRAINLLIDLGDEGVLFGVGTAQYDIRECRGPMGGPFTGPLPGDLGDWVSIDFGTGQW